MRRWRALLEDRKASGAARKKAIVALARQLAVDLWRMATWMSGRLKNSARCLSSGSTETLFKEGPSPSRETFSPTEENPLERRTLDTAAERDVRTRSVD